NFIISHNIIDNNYQESNDNNIYDNTEIVWIFPLEGYALKGLEILVATLKNIKEAVSYWFTLNSKDINATLEGESIIANINTFEFEDNNYELTANVCTLTACFSRTIKVEINNDKKNKNTDKVSVEPDNIKENFYLKLNSSEWGIKLLDKENKVIESGIDIEAQKGNYNIEIVPLKNSRINNIKIIDFEIDYQTKPIEISEIDISTPLQWLEWKEVLKININTNFQKGTIKILLDDEKQQIFVCEEFEKKNFEKLNKIKKNELTSQIDFTNKEIIVGIAKKSKNKRAIDLVGKKNFSLAEKPNIKVKVNSNKSLSKKYLNFILEKNGETITIPEEEIIENENQILEILLKEKRNIRPGNYVLKAFSEEEEIEEYLDFSWGVLSVNTKKSLYKPNENVEIEIVVLNGEGKPVCGAQIEMDIISPDGLVVGYSTQNNSILPGYECGLYDANYIPLNSGVYEIKLRSLDNDIDFNTSFLVQENQKYNIIRKTLSKIDPTRNNNINVEIEVWSFEGDKEIEFFDYVPKEFEIRTNGVVSELEDYKKIFWKGKTWNGKIVFSYNYSVPFEWPLLYKLGKAEIKTPEENFVEYRNWYVAVDPLKTTVFHVTNEADYYYSEPAPNDAVSGKTFVGTSTQSFYGMHPIGPNFTGGDSKTTGTTTVGTYRGITWVSPPLAKQTIPAGTWVLTVWAKESNANDNIRLRPSIMVWADANDAKRGDIINFIGTNELTTTMSKYVITMPDGKAMNIENGDKLIVEIDFNTTASTLATARVDFNWNLSFIDGNIVAPANLRLLSGKDFNTLHVWRQQDKNYSEPAPNDAATSDTFIGTSVQSFYLMHPDMPMGGTLRGPGKTTGTTTVGTYKGVTWISPPLRAQNIPAGAWSARLWAKELANSDNLHLETSIMVWADKNNSKKGNINMYKGTGAELTTTMALRAINFTSNTSSPITLDNKDKIIFEIDFNALGSTNATARVDFNWNHSISVTNSGVLTNRDGNLVAPIDINLFAQNLQPVILAPNSDNNSSINLNVDFLVMAETYCDGNYWDCGNNDVSIQWCKNEGCTDFRDANSSSGEILLISGANPAFIRDFNSGDKNSFNKWVLRATQPGTYELRVRSKGWNTDANFSSGSDRTITVSAGGPDYSFTVLLPISGCTEGKGSVDNDNSCDRGYFEATDLQGYADENQVSPQGQTTEIPFFIIDNQSTTSSDFNITMELNAILPPTIVLKISNKSIGYHGTCSNVPDNNCVIITNSPKNAGKVFYSPGIQDLNVWFWSDFINALGGLYEDRNLTTTGINPG
ncbi:MAG: hypothetical protein QXZ13_01880, partial [Candidatus Diapherotrites archaeon]